MDEIAWRIRRQVDDLECVFYHPDSRLHNRLRNPSEASALILDIQSARLLAVASLSSDAEAVLAALILGLRQGFGPSATVGSVLFVPI